MGSYGFSRRIQQDPMDSNCFAVLRKLVWKKNKGRAEMSEHETLTDPAFLALWSLFHSMWHGVLCRKIILSCLLTEGIHMLVFLKQSSWNWIVQLYNPRKYMQILKITMVFGLLQYLQYYHQTAACESWQPMHPRRQCPWRIMASSFSSNDLGEGWMAINNYCRLT